MPLYCHFYANNWTHSISLVKWLCYLEAKTPPVLHCPIGPPGALYIAANHEIVRYLLDGSSEDILISGLKGVTDIAVDYQDEMVSEWCYNYMLCLWLIS